jgi:hypothetical protein
MRRNGEKKKDKLKNAVRAKNVREGPRSLITAHQRRGNWEIRYAYAWNMHELTSSS